MSDKLTGVDVMAATMEAMSAASAKVLAGEFFFSDRQVGMFILLVQQEMSVHVGTPELQAKIASQITELNEQSAI